MLLRRTRAFVVLGICATVAIMVRGKMEMLGNPRSSFCQELWGWGIGMDSKSEGTGFREVNCPNPGP